MKGSANVDIAQKFHLVNRNKPHEKAAFWYECSKIAHNDADGPLAGMAKIAFSIWAAQAGKTKLAADRSAREAFASSFGSSLIAMATVEKLASERAITNLDAVRLRSLIIDSAFADLDNMCKCADEMAPELQETPSEEEPPTTEDDETLTEDNAGALKDLERGYQVVRNMIFLANQVQMPQLAADLEQNAEMLANHFAQGNAYLPVELQKHFPKSEHVEQFMKKYTQRFGRISSK